MMKKNDNKSEKKKGPFVGEPRCRRACFPARGGGPQETSFGRRVTPGGRNRGAPGVEDTKPPRVITKNGREKTPATARGGVCPPLIPRWGVNRAPRNIPPLKKGSPP